MFQKENAKEKLYQTKFNKIKGQSFKPYFIIAFEPWEILKKTKCRKQNAPNTTQHSKGAKFQTLVCCSIQTLEKHSKNQVQKKNYNKQN
jgi:hypothetical protein